MTYNFLYRDTKLSNDLIAKYVTGSFLLESAFTDCTKLRSGVGDNNLRYLFISNEGVDFSKVTKGKSKEKAERLGLVVFQRSAVFHVLDVYKLGNKTQVLMSPDNYLPQDEIEQIIEAARTDFDELIGSPVLPELGASEWQDRLFFPVGLNGIGVLLNKSPR